MILVRLLRSDNDAETKRKGEPGRSNPLWLVSNRLPVTAVRARSGVVLRESTGGVASGLSDVYRERGARWIGWPGRVPPTRRRSIARELASSYACHPVFLPDRLVRDFYLGFASHTLWPLFHSFSTYARYLPEEWSAYREANTLFAEAVAKIVDARDTIWVHDFQLLLLPSLLRERLPDAKIGFFLHIPFPPFDVLRLLPWSRDLLRGLLGADLIGFHTYDDAQSFLHGARRLLGLDNEIGRFVWGGRVVQADVFPMGVDVARFATTTVPIHVADAIERLHGLVGGAKLAFSISRLDYTKGTPQALLAFERLFERHPKYRKEVTYLLVVVPSREKVEQNRVLKKEVDELVGRINSRFGSLEWTPIRYMYRQLPFDELLALYRVSDIAVVTPLRDGMNLIAKEFLVARPDDSGVLVLSEMAGASKELTEALLVNPNNVDDVTGALHEALRMPAKEQARRNRIMRARLEANDVGHWADRFLARLDASFELSRRLAVRMLGRGERKAILDGYAAASRRLILLDYDGTLVPLHDRPEQAAPPEELIEVLKVIADSPRDRIAIVSGRRRDDLDAWFDALPLTLAAEHGAWVRDPAKGGWESQPGLSAEWKSRIWPILELYVDRVPGSFVEEKDFSLCWHYRSADFESGAAAAHDLLDALTALTANLDLHVVPGRRVIEVKSTRATKGHFVSGLLPSQTWDFVFAAGDDATDESLFAALPKDAVSIRVGLAISVARFNVEGSKDLLSLLKQFASSKRASQRTHRGRG